MKRRSNVSRVMGMLLVSGCLLPLGCDKKSEAPTEAPSATAAPSTVASAVPSVSAAPSAAAPAGKMAHCPNTVAGATAVIHDSADGVVVTVSAKDAAATQEIRERAKFLAESAKKASPEVKHNGSGEGGGVFGRCPIVMRNTAVTSKETEGGAELTLKPQSAKELDWLRREVRDRQKELGDPNAKEAGQGKMAHCPSAVSGATTVIKDTKDGFEVTVTAKDEAATKEIRDRGAKLLAASKVDPTAIAHKGDGSGGGGLGRCPVVLDDTTVESKEVAGGSTFIVKPKKPTGLATVRKEARDRAQAFTSSSK